MYDMMQIAGLALAALLVGVSMYYLHIIAKKPDFNNPKS
jgi:hypothetical protein